jgi:hypothetical protein
MSWSFLASALGIGGAVAVVIGLGYWMVREIVNSKREKAVQDWKTQQAEQRADQAEARERLKDEIQANRAADPATAVTRMRERARRRKDGK